MPWTAKDAPKGRTGKLAEKWARVANSVRRNCLKEGKPESECDALAKIVANKQTMSAARK